MPTMEEILSKMKEEDPDEAANMQAYILKEEEKKRGKQSMADIIEELKREREAKDPGFLSNLFEAYKKFGKDVPIIGPALKEGGQLGGEAIGYMMGYSPEDREKARQAIEEREQQFEREHPYAATTASVAGAMAIPPVFKGIKAAKDASTLSRVGTGLLSSGGRVGEAAATAAMDAAVRDRDALKEGAQAGLFSAGMEGLGKAAGTAGTFLFGVPKKTRVNYAERRGQVKAADRGELFENIRSSIREGEGRLYSAERRIKEAEKNISDWVRDYKFRLKNEEPPPEVTVTIIESLGDLQNRISKKSGEAFDILRAEGKDIDAIPYFDIIDKRIKSFQIQGLPPKTEGYNELVALRNRLNEVVEATAENTGKSGVIQPVDLKLFIQEANDKLSEIYAKKEGARYLSRPERAIKDSVSDLNKELYKIDKYSEVMQDVSKETKLKKQFENYYTSQVGPKLDESVYRSMRTLDKKEKVALRDMYNQLESTVGEDILGQLRQYEMTKKLYRMDPVEFGKKSPYYREKIRGQKDLDRTRDIYKEIIDDRTKKTILTEKQAEALIDNIAARGRPKRQAKENLQKLSDTVNKIAPPDKQVDFVQMAEDLKIKESFEKGFQIGSRNTNLWQASLAGLAALIGRGLRLSPVDIPVATRVGGAVGAHAGGWIDIAGPKIYQMLSDLSAHPKFKIFSVLGERAYQRSPQAFINFQLLAAERNPEYKDYLINYFGDKNR